MVDVALGVGLAVLVFVGIAVLVGIGVAVLATVAVDVGAMVGVAGRDVAVDVAATVAVDTVVAVGVEEALVMLLEPHAANVPSIATPASRLPARRIKRCGSAIRLHTILPGASTYKSAT